MAYVAYKDNEDGTYSFMDDAGQTTAPMAGPAAEQHVNKLKAQGAEPVPGVEAKTAVQSGQAPMPPPAPSIRGERAELSPEMLEAGAAGPDMRTAAFTKAPNGSVIDAGGSPDGGLTLEQQQLSKLIDNGMSAQEAKNYLKERQIQEQNWQSAKAAGQKALDWLGNQASRIGSAIDERKNEERVKAGLPPRAVAAPTGDSQKQMVDTSGETVAPEDRVQLKAPPAQNMLAMAPTSAPTPPQFKEMKVGEATAYTTVDPQAQADLKRAQQNQYLAEEGKTESVAQANQNIGGVLKEVPQGLTDMEAQRQSMEQSIADRVQKDHEELDTLRGEARRELDTGRFWKKKSNGEKFAGALAMGLGAYVQAMGGGPNTAMTIINNAIQDDIMEQKENRAAARDRFQDKRLQMSDKKQVFQDERQNFLGKKMQYLEIAQAKVAGFIQDAKTAEQKAQGEDMMARLQKEDAMTRAEFSKVSHQVQTKVVQVGGAGGRGSGISELDHEKYVPQFGGIAPTKEEAVLARQKGAGLDTMKRLVSENVRLREHPEAFVKGSDKYAELKSNQSKIILTLKRKENEDLGVIAGPDMELMLGTIGDGSSIVPGQTAAMKNFLANENRVNENVRRNIGLIPVETAPIRDEKTGEIRIGQMVTGNIVTPKNVTGAYKDPIQTVHIAKTARQDKK